MRLNKIVTVHGAGKQNEIASVFVAEVARTFGSSWKTETLREFRYRLVNGDFHRRTSATLFGRVARLPLCVESATLYSENVIVCWLQISDRLI